MPAAITPHGPGRCNRSATSGSGTTWYCDKIAGHDGPHTDHWLDRDDVPRLGLSWTHESYDGSAVWPESKGAIPVTKEWVAGDIEGYDSGDPKSPGYHDRMVD